MSAWHKRPCRSQPRASRHRRSTRILPPARPERSNPSDCDTICDPFHMRQPPAAANESGRWDHCFEATKRPRKIMDVCRCCTSAAACEAGHYTAVRFEKGTKMRRRSLPLEPARIAAGAPVPSVRTLARRLAEVQALRRQVHMAEQRQARGEVTVVYAPKVSRRAAHQRAH